MVGIFVLPHVQATVKVRKVTKNHINQYNDSIAKLVLLKLGIICLVGVGIK